MLLQVEALVNRLEKNAPSSPLPKAPQGLPQSPPPSSTPERAPEPLKRIIKEAASIPALQDTDERNPSMHLGGVLPGSGNGSRTDSGKFGKIEETPVRPRFGSDYGSGSFSAADVDGEDKSAIDALSDASASEEIFGKAFKGGRKAAAGLVARLQREVTGTTRMHRVFFMTAVAPA